ncbi:MAG: GTPase Era [Eubacteriales bacterium]|nr:GTPase Era [Eubacteriales bacterium]
MTQNYKSGFFSIVGCPNVGKSTLLNTLVGQKIAIVTDRAQTTRNKITGVVTRADYQMIFLDTPGLTMPRNKLGEYMQKVALDAFNDIEAVVLLIDPLLGVKERDEKILDRLRQCKSPVIVAINKADKATMAQLEQARFAIGEGFEIMEISAKTGEGVDKLEKRLADFLVEGPQYFPPDMVTDQPERVICSEMIREKALQLLSEEIPHGVGVGIDKMEMREGGGLMDVYATMYCERDSHKAIIIGRGGSMLKRIGMESRKDIEWLLGVRVNLQLWVKVKEDWRNKQSMLNELGYDLRN